jgi:hypothetical protein
VKGDVDLRNVHGPRTARQHGVLGREVTPRTVAAERTFDEIRPFQAERREDALLQRVAQRHAGRLLDDEPQHDVVAAVVGPPLARREQAGLLHDQPELIARTESPAMGGVPAVRLEERDDVVDEIRKAARVVQELTDADAPGERRRVAVEVEQPVSDELKDERGHEDLRHAPDPEAVIGRERLAGSQVCEADRFLNLLVRPERYRDGARNAGRDNGFELIADRFHPAEGEPNDPIASAPHQERSRGPAPELARQPA